MKIRIYEPVPYRREIAVTPFEKFLERIDLAAERWLTWLIPNRVIDAADRMVAADPLCSLARSMFFTAEPITQHAIPEPISKPVEAEIVAPMPIEQPKLPTEPTITFRQGAARPQQPQQLAEPMIMLRHGPAYPAQPEQRGIAVDWQIQPQYQLDIQP